MRLAQESDGVLVMGSSVMVYSAYRLVKAATKTGAKLAIINIGTTRVDSLAEMKVCYLLTTTRALWTSGLHVVPAKQGLIAQKEE